MGGMAPVPARPEPMVAGGRVLGEDGQGRAMTGPILLVRWDIPGHEYPIDKPVPEQAEPQTAKSKERPVSGE